MPIAPSRFAFVLSATGALVGTPATAAEDEYRVALKELSRSASSGETSAFLDAFRTVVRKNDPRSVRSAVEAYSEIAPAAMKSLSPREFMALHGGAASEFAAVTRKEAVAEVKRLLTKAREWHGRLLCLDGSGFLKPSLLLESCRTALHDPHPVVIRRALRYLVKSRDVTVAGAIVDRYADLETKKKDPDPEWSRTLLAFQATLEQMLKLDLPAASDYKNYFEAHKGDADLFDPRRFQGGARTGVSLFGTVITGKNIAFVVDVSGSMLSTDPLPGDAPRAARPRTVVGDPSRQPAPTKEELPSERQRMARAKTELVKVVRALPEDVRFNIISYSSDVTAWKKAMVPASDANKKAAVAHIESLKAEGITVTDLALEEAFADLQLDTVYLITDGAPTHIGSSGPGLPEDAPQLIRAIHARVEELNFLRGVRVFTLGFPEAEEEFLKKLAAAHGGTYAAIR
jgi:hypothetical protein